MSSSSMDANLIEIKFFQYKNIPMGQFYFSWVI